MYPGTFAATTPDKAALIMADTGETLTYAELEDRTIRLAHALHDGGLRPGDSFALLAENGPRHHECYWAALRSGLYLTALNIHLSDDEQIYIVRDCGAKVLIVSAAMADLARPDRRSGARDRGAARVRWPGGWPGRRLRRLRDGPRRGLGRAASPTSPPAPTCSTPPAPPGAPRAIQAPLPERQVDEPGDLLVAVFGSIYALRRPTPSTSRRRRSTTRRRCASAASCTRSAAPS